MGGDLVRYAGYKWLKSYLFISILPIICVLRIDLTKPAVAIVSMLSVSTITIFLISYFNFSFATKLYMEFGQPYGLWSMGTKDYGRFFLPNAQQVFFHTATLIIIPISYFAMKIYYSKGAAKTFYSLLLLINIVAMFLGATKTNIVVSITLPMFVVYWYSKRKKAILWGTILLFTACIMYNFGEIKMMLSLNEPSNSLKLSYIKDYLSLFRDKNILLFGQGLGSFFYTTVRGWKYLTELTYFEFIRSYGIILSLPLFALILYPLSKLRSKQFYSRHYIFIAYLFYLIMAFSNPLFVSSSGMLLLVLVLYKTFSPVFPPIYVKYMQVRGRNY
jgi:hypothetical protein